MKYTHELLSKDKGDKITVEFLVAFPDGLKQGSKYYFKGFPDGADRTGTNEESFNSVAEVFHHWGWKNWRVIEDIPFEGNI